MENCFFKVFKSAVDNDNLPRMDEIRIKVYIPSTCEDVGSQKIGIYTSGSCVVYASEPLCLSFDGNNWEDSLTLQAGTNIVWLKKGLEFYLFAPKYDTLVDHTQIENEYIGYDVSDTKYKNGVVGRGLSIYNNKNIVGDVSDLLEGFNLESGWVQLYGSGVYGNLTKFGNLKNASVLFIHDLNLSGDTSALSQFNRVTNMTLYNTKLSGNIASLGACTSLSTRIDFGNIGIYGTIESFVAGQRTNGRTSGNITSFVGWNTMVTFNGHAIGGATLSWTNSTITYGSETINA